MFDGIEKINIRFEKSPQAHAPEKVGMRRDHQSILSHALANLVQRIQVLRPCAEIIDQGVAGPFGCDLHPGDQGYSQAARIIRETAVPDVEIVAGNRQNFVTKPGGLSDELFRRMPADPEVHGIQAAVRMQLGFKPACAGRIASICQHRHLYAKYHIGKFPAPAQ